MKRGFTLAEVLITLSIIGIISALTLPGLRTGLGTRKADSWYAKYCNILDGAMKQAMFSNDVANATDVTMLQLYGQLQAMVRTCTDVQGSTASCAFMKDGTVVNATLLPGITVKFPDSSNVNNRRYVVRNEFEGVDCTTNGQ